MTTRTPSIWEMPSLQFEVESHPPDSCTVIDTQIDTIIDEPIVLSGNEFTENEVTENGMTEYNESTDDDNSSVDSIIIKIYRFPA